MPGEVTYKGAHRPGRWLLAIGLAYAAGYITCMYQYAPETAEAVTRPVPAVHVTHTP